MTAPARPVEMSLFPDVAPDKPTGPIVGSVQTGTNADLIAKIAPFYLDGGTVLDVTYGRGLWWTRYRPDTLETHDLDVDGVDFRHLPEADRSVDAVCFDPPYIPAGGERSTGFTTDEAAFRDRFGLAPRSEADLRSLIAAGIAECARVARRYVLVKCCDFTSGGQFKVAHFDIIGMGVDHGLAVHDLIVHATGSGPGGHNIFTPQRTRRAHSYLIVFRRGGRRR